MLIVGGTCLHVCAAGFLMIHPKQMIKISTSGDTDDQVQEGWYDGDYNSLRLPSFSVTMEHNFIYKSLWTIGNHNCYFIKTK